VHARVEKLVTANRCAHPFRVYSFHTCVEPRAVLTRPTCWDRLSVMLTLFTAQCTLVHMRGFGIACRPSVCLSVRPSVTLVIFDHIGWKSWKLIARTTSPTPSLFLAKRRSTYSHRGTWGNFGNRRTDGQTDGQTDGRHAIPRPRICTKVHCAVINSRQPLTSDVIC